jgi:hypothetical protein
MMNNQEVFNSTFPVIERINLPFAEVPGITLEELAFLSDSEYLNRLNLFYQYIEIKYPFFKLADYPALLATGTDTDLCPLDYTMSMTLFANLRLELSESGSNKEAAVFLDLTQFNGTLAPSGQNLIVTVLVKEFFEGEFINWSNVEGIPVQVAFGPTDTSREVLPLFRYKGVDDETKDFKSVYVQILDVEEGDGVEKGQITTVFTNPFEPFYLVNLISNIQTSFQDFPSQETLEVVVLNGQGIQNGDLSSFTFEFAPGQKMRPVFLYPATYPDLSTIDYVTDGGMNILSAGAFYLQGEEPTRVIIDGIEYKVYASQNMIVFNHRAKYEYNF